MAKKVKKKSVRPNRVAKPPALVPVKIVDRDENSSAYTLAGGDIIKLKPVIMDVEKQTGVFDAHGNQVYLVKAAVIIQVEHKKTRRR